MKMNGIKNFFQNLISYTKTRPSQGEESTSPVSAAFGGGFTDYVATGDPAAAAGGALGGYVGLKVGEKTKSFPKAVTASVATGAAATSAATAGVQLAKAALNGAAVAVNPVGVGVMAVIGGASGLVGTLQGSSSGDVKDNSTAGMLTGSVMSAMGGSPLLTASGALSGAISGLFESKAGKILSGIGSGAALGAAAGIFGGPVGMAINAALGAATGGIAATGGKAFGNVTRNVTQDLQKGIAGKLRKYTKKLGIKGRTILGALGGAISSAPMALLFGAVGGPVVGALAVVGSAALTGYKVNKVLNRRKKNAEFSKTMNKFLEKDFTKEQIESTPPQAMAGLTAYFAEKYKKPEQFGKISQEEFRKGMADFQQKALLAAQQAQQKE